MDQVIAPGKKDKSGPNRWKPGHAKVAGRQKGSTNKVPRLLKEAILMAAELEGSDGRGKDKLVGFLRHVARDDLRSFVMLLGRVLPLQVHTKGDMREVTYRSVDEVRQELAARGISMATVAHILHLPAELIDHEGVEMVAAERMRT